jgi:hypothetical protein
MSPSHDGTLTEIMTRPNEVEEPEIKIAGLELRWFVIQHNGQQNKVASCQDRKLWLKTFGQIAGSNPSQAPDQTTAEELVLRKAMALVTDLAKGRYTSKTKTRAIEIDKEWRSLR